jgi:hypothetical protein
MQLCEHKHELIVHDESECPLCTALDAIKDLEGELKVSQVKIENLENEICELENK